MSRAGKEVLLKSVDQALPNYVMSIVLLLRGVCYDIERMFNAFWWGSKLTKGNGLNWMSWDRLCVPKAFGGMGFRRLHEFNLALLCKQGWKLMLEPTSLLTQMLKAWYFPHSTFLQASLGNNPSYTRRSIWAIIDILCRHSWLSVGDGASILVTKDPWLPVDGLGMVTTKLRDAYKEVRVKELFQLGTQQ